MPEMPWKEAAVFVLRKAGQALDYKVIAEEIEKEKLRKSFGATPASTVSVIISQSILKEGLDSPFVKVGRGAYMLRSLADGVPSPQEQQVSVVEEIEEKPIVKCVGM